MKVANVDFEEPEMLFDEEDGKDEKRVHFGRCVGKKKKIGWMTSHSFVSPWEAPKIKGRTFSKEDLPTFVGMGKYDEFQHRSRFS